MSSNQLKLLKSRIDWLWALLILIALAKLALVFGQPVVVINGPHDDSLYVYRAVHLLAGEAFGPYTSTTLDKYPGLSFWLAGGAALGLPYLFTLNVLFAAAGLYLCAGLRAVGASAIAVLVGAGLYFFHPFTFGVGWMRVLREPLATVLLVFMAASLIYTLRGLATNRLAQVHVAIFSLSLAVASMTREEDVLLYVIPVVAFACVLWNGYRTGLSRRLVALSFLAFGLPVVFSLGANAAARLYVAHSYGLPILHDYGEGEFPRMIAAMRSVRAKRDNRYVLISQEAIRAIVRQVPRFASLARRLPTPGPDSVSCGWLGLCTEWGAGWFLFWIKDAAYEAGLTPSLPAGQAYFRAVREDIEAACASGRLRCEREGNGLFPPFELRWTRALAQEAGDLAMMFFRPDAAPRQLPTSVGMPRLEEAFRLATRSPLVPAAATVEQARQRESRFDVWWRLHSLVTMVCLGLALVACIRALSDPRPIFGTVFGEFLTAVGAYVFLRFAALSYLAVYMGRYDPRIMMSTHILLALLAFPLFLIGTRWRVKPGNN